jgi:amidase
VLLGGEAVASPAPRLIVASDAFAQVDAEVAALGREFLQRAAEMLPPQTDVVVAPQGFDEWREAFRIVQAKEVWETFGDFVTRAKPRLGPGVKERMEFAATVTAQAADAARKVVATGRSHLRALVPPGTIVVLPTAPSIAPPVDLTSDAMESFRVRVMRLTCMAGLGGLPQMNLPIGTVAGCPAGLSLMAWPCGDEALLDLAVLLARACGIAR